ncbi:hypothetical protein NDU88_004809 [Pleurodeles waltl]|uniref:Reverse transcriptase n=1 Tax=Pleurodeles waltl TaxID=8319 RepID=A0AAV7MYA3_PLEWA|nr:hypothetical protein NDU88_004809 [Pleurodeles waltl]
MLLDTYGANVDCPNFFHTILKQCLAVNPDTIIWGEDHNLVLNTDLDCSDHHKQCVSKALTAFLDTVAQLNILDIWWKLHGMTREYTFHSSVHDTPSRVDFWVGTRDVVGWTRVLRHLPRTLSDHSPVILKLAVPVTWKQTPLWRLQPRMVLGKAFRKEIRSAIQAYITSNKDFINTVATFWEALKAVIRGKCITKEHVILRSIRDRLARLEMELHNLELQYDDIKNKSLLSCMKKALTEFCEEVDREVKFLCEYTQARKYGEVDRAGHTLAMLLKPRWSANYIYTVDLPDERSHHTPEGVLQEFVAFYWRLYTSHTCATPEVIDT